MCANGEAAPTWSARSLRFEVAGLGCMYFAVIDIDARPPSPSSANLAVNVLVLVLIVAMGRMCGGVGVDEACRVEGRGADVGARGGAGGARRARSCAAVVYRALCKRAGAGIERAVVVDGQKESRTRT